MQLSFRWMQKSKKNLLDFLISTEKETKSEKKANPADFRIKKFLFLSSTFFLWKKKKIIFLGVHFLSWRQFNSRGCTSEQSFNPGQLIFNFLSILPPPLFHFTPPYTPSFSTPSPRPPFPVKPSYLFSSPNTVKIIL